MAELTMSERVQAPTGTCPARLRPLPSRFVTWVAVTILAAMAFTWELETSALQARLLAGIATQAGWKVDPGPSDHIHFPASGPHDERLGYTHIPDFVSRLTGAGYEVESQARFSRWLERLTDAGLFPLYREKVQAGLRILGDDGRPLYASRFPRRVYADFDAIPRVLVDSLLFVENRELLDPRFPKRNPAVDWSRFGHGLFTLVADAIGHGDDVAGGSTLTTQMEKYRHSRGGLTATPVEKLRQIVSASLRAYRSGEITAPARRQIVADYFNTVPLAAAPGHGEVIGLPEGLEVWYGRDYHELAEVLGPGPRVRSEDPDALEERALAYKQALSLLLAVQRPSRFLVEHPEALERRTDAYLPLLASQGVISPELGELGRLRRRRRRPRAST
jgi:membrane peptidoglycan carboxypeptidase